MVIVIKPEPFEIDVPGDIALRIAKEEFQELTESNLITFDCSIRMLIERRIYRIIYQYDAGKMDFIRERLGITDEE
jgi:hypothetical protein